ncbi:MAG: amidohydrolase family protein [Anaerovoracaceae bacterium]|jgi:predicted TIM-barrel fold metal-dependent hydrolase
MIRDKKKLEELEAFAAEQKKYDAHAHVGYSGGWADVGITEKELIRQMDDYNIETTALCCLDNEVTLRMMKEYPGRINGCIYVDPLSGDALDLVDRYAEQGFGAVKLNPLHHAFCADSEAVDPVVEKAEALGLPVVIHSGHPPYSLPWQIALLAERHPKERFLMIHMGHGHGVYIDAALKMARRFPNIWLEMSGMPMPDKIREAYETVGSGRILFGTDAPFHHPVTELEKVLTSGLGQEAIRKILYDNAVVFFAR